MLSKHARFFLGRLLEMWHHFSQSSANYATRSPATKMRYTTYLLRAAAFLMSCVRYYFTTHLRVYFVMMPPKVIRKLAIHQRLGLTGRNFQVFWMPAVK